MTGCPAARVRRGTTGQALGIGECNAKRFLARANRFRVTRQELEAALL
ncbi:MAG: DUF4093 domain-containing protein [Gracilibacteraceae bacterium]|nr:DUF4093 domain-containing protein [Gracilibacteraceae bacterium]